MTFFPWLIAAVGCAPSLPEPTLEAIAPVWGWNGESTDVTLVGTNLLPEVFAYADTRDDHRVYADFQVELVNQDGLVIPLSGEELDTYRALSAQVPLGHPVGVYDVRLTTPSGTTTELENGFTITETRSDHLEFLVEEVAFQVHQTAVFGVLLADPDGQAVGEDLAVEIWADPDQGAEGAVFSLSGLKEVSALTDRVGLRGRLGSDGEAYLSMTTETPGGVRLYVEPEDDDSYIRGDEVFFDFAPGAIEEVKVTLPSKDFTAVAGQAFPVSLSVLDVYGNVVDDQGTDLWLEEVCGTYRVPVTVVGSTSIQVAVTGATDASCTQNQLLVSGSASGASEMFGTIPGFSDSLRILPAGPIATAGVPYPVFIWAEDAYGNTVQDYESVLNVTDSMGSLSSVSCEEGTIRYCILTLTKAGMDTVLIASDDHGATGESEPITVVAGPATVLSITGPSSPLVAGVAASVTAQVADSFDNPVAIDPTGADVFSAEDGSGTATCDWEGEPLPGTHDLACLTTQAGLAVSLVVSLDSLGLATAAEVVDVENAPLAQVVAVANPDTVAAGESFTLDVVASDEFGNPYLVQTDPVLELGDPDLTLVPQVLTLEADGTGSGSFVLTRSGDPVTVTISQAGAVLGTTDLFVSPADPDHLELDLEVDWAWLDAPVTVQVTAHDVYDNVVPDFSSPVLLASTQGSLNTADLTGFSGGIATGSLSWAGAVLADSVTALADSGEAGTSDGIDILDADCVSPPTAVLTLAGQEEAVSCRVGGVATVTASFSGSTATAGLSAYHLEDGQGSSQRLSVANTVLSTPDEGGWTVGLVVMDNDACGAETSGIWWTGDADGEPVGPVALSTTHSQRTAGSATNGATTVEVGATTCSGDVASGATLLVRADLGTLGGLTATGAGLEVVLDSLGEASLTWSVETESHAGTASLEAGTGDGTSWGESTVTVAGDSARPTVVDAIPSGNTSELLEELVVVFSEPMTGSSLSSSTVTLEGPLGAVELAAFDLDEAGTTLTVDLDSQLDTSLGEWNLTVTSSARDEAGNNRLDGEWSGASSDHVRMFGEVGIEEIEITSCLADTEVFTPDGDDGVGEERDSVSVQVTATGIPTWWELEVRDDAGGAVYTTREPSSASEVTMGWHGRGDDGFVVEEGSYTLAFSAFDAYDNQSLSCDAELILAQHYGNPR